MVGVRAANPEEWPSGIWSNPPGGLGGPQNTIHRLHGAAAHYVQAGAWHELGVVARGREVLLLVDGAPVASWEGEPVRSGGIGLISYFADVRFDNLRVWALDGYRETRYSYDGVGNRVAARDPVSHTTVYIYDGLNRLVAVEDADPGTGPPGL